jgi:integrase
MSNIFKRVRPSGFYAWYVRYRDPVTGIDIKRSAGKTKADADRFLTKIKSEIHEGTYESKQRQSKVTFFEIADDFLAYSRARKRSCTKDGRSVKKLKEFFGDIPCGQFKRSMIDQFIASRKTEKGHNGNLIQSATVNRELACLKTIFRRAYMDGKIAYNPLAGFKLLEEDNVRDRVLTEEEFQKLLFATPAHLRPVLITAWETGMRKGEILNLQ